MILTHGSGWDVRVCKECHRMRITLLGKRKREGERES